MSLLRAAQAPSASLFRSRSGWLSAGVHRRTVLRGPRGHAPHAAVLGLPIILSVDAPDAPLSFPGPLVPEGGTLGWSGAQELIRQAQADLPEAMPTVYRWVHESAFGQTLETAMLMAHHDLGLPWWLTLAGCMVTVRGLSLFAQISTMRQFDRLRRLEPFLYASRAAALSPADTEVAEAVPMLPDPKEVLPGGIDPPLRPEENWRGLLDPTPFFRGNQEHYRRTPVMGDAGRWAAECFPPERALHPKDSPSQRLRKLNRFLRIVRREHRARPYLSVARSLATIVPVMASGIACRVLLLLDPLKDASMGGMLWFSDLTVGDSSFALPVLNTVILYAIYEYIPEKAFVHKSQLQKHRQQEQEQPQPAAAAAEAAVDSPAPQPNVSKNLRQSGKASGRTQSGARTAKQKHQHRQHKLQPPPSVATEQKQTELPELPPEPDTVQARLRRLFDPARLYRFFLDRMQWLTLIMLPISLNFPAGVNWLVFVMCVVSALFRLLRSTSWFKNRMGFGLPQYPFVFVKR